jgi:hypothetical protein
MWGGAFLISWVQIALVLRLVTLLLIPSAHKCFGHHLDWLIPLMGGCCAFLSYSALQRAGAEFFVQLVISDEVVV